MKLLQRNFQIIPALMVLGFLFATTFSAQAQNVEEGKREFMKKTTANALTIVVEGDDKNVEHVMDELFSKSTGGRAKSEKGFTAFRNSRVANISNATMDVFYRVERASKNDPPQARVTLFLSSGNENFMTSATHPDEIGKATEFLQGLQLDVTKYEFTLAIEAQNKVIEKEIKDHEKLVKDSMDLEQKLAETIEAIANNKVARANQLVKIEEEKQNLINSQQTLAALEQHGLKGLEMNSQQNMDKQLESVARKPGMDEDKKLEIEDKPDDNNNNNNN